MRSTRRAVALILSIGVVASACSSQPAAERPETLTIIAHDSFASAASETGAFDLFTEETGVSVEILAAGDAGTLVNQAVLTKDNPLADVLFGVDDTFLSRALDEDIFSDHRSRHIGDVVEGLADPQHRVTPISFGDVCIKAYNQPCTFLCLPSSHDTELVNVASKKARQRMT